jgi:hypothetical protein
MAIVGRPRKRLFNEFEVVERYKNGESSKSIAQDVGTGADVVLRVVKKAGIIVKSGVLKRKFSEEIVNEMKRLYEGGMSQKEIAVRYSISQQGVGKMLEREDVVARMTKAWNTLDESYFNVIDSEEKAYWLGFLTADGNLGKDNAIRLELKNGDAVHVVRFARAIKFFGKISQRADDGAVLLQPKSVVMIDALKKHGLNVSTKSFDAEPADVCDTLKRHYWRGVVDGDGWITKELDSIGLCGTQKMCQGLKDFFIENGVVTEAKVAHSQENMYRFSIGSQEVKKCVSLLYSDVKVALPRKLSLAKKVFGEQVFSGVKRIQQYDAKMFIEAVHYLKDVPVGSILYGLFVDDVLRGVACFGSPSSPAVAGSLFEDKRDAGGVRELRRFALQDAQKNEASMFLSKALKLLKEDVDGLSAIVSFADSAQGHIGTIYQACNARYFGCSGKEIVVTLSSGERLTGRGIVNRIQGETDVKIDVSGGKFKYVFFVSEDVRRKCVIFEQEYPKN